FGKIDILVNNSGATWGAPVEEMPLEAWNKVMQVNATGTFLMSKAVGKHMIEQKFGKIINLASAAGLKVRPPEVRNTIGYTTIKETIPLQKVGDENMLKGAAIYLAAQASDFVTGTVLSVDGGSTL